MTPEQFAEIVADAALSPSVHNIQPSLWRRIDANAVALLQADGRTLPVGDPTGRDVAASHGAAAEGFVIAASARGFDMAVQPGVSGEVARLIVTGRRPADPLFAVLHARRTYRGRFTGAPATSALATLRDAAPDLMILSDREDVDFIARLNDVASLGSFRRKPFRAELLSWMRLSPRHPDWARDGLNADAMNMSRFEAFAAGVVLRPVVFEMFDRLGLAGILTGEAEVVRSSAAIALLTAAPLESPFDTGRRWHRLWLEITRSGLSAAPMTGLADDARTASALGARFDLPAGHRLVTAMRIGVTPENAECEAARLPVEVVIGPA